MRLNPFLFRGFEPTPELNEAANLSMASALALSPNDSIPFGYIVKDKDRYRGHLEICSSQGIFSAYATSVEPEVVLAKLRARILKQLKRWRKNRFSPPTPAHQTLEIFA
jgi:hypothetical protein